MILYLYGENQFGLHKQVEAIKAKYLEKTGSDADMQTFDLSEQSMGDLLGALAVTPMFVSSRLMIVKDIAAAKPTREQVEEIVKHTPESTNVVFIDPKPDKRALYFKEFSKLPGAQNFFPLDKPKLTAWLQKEAAKQAADISPADISYLIELIGSDQWRLQNELQKLAANNPKIVRETIDTLVVPSTEYSSFTLVDALVKKDLSRTLKLYDQLTTQGEADQMILGAIMYQYRVFLAIIAGGDATKTMGIAPYALQKSHRVMRNMDLADLKTAYNCLAEADLAIKSGRLSSQEALKRLFRKLCS
jgi:DNA polymerase-3 subunit delta